MSKVLQVRLDPGLKSEAEKILEEMGMDLPTAIRIFLKKVVKTSSIPFLVSSRALTENGFTPEFENEVLKASASKDLSPVFHNAKDLINYLDEKDHGNSNDKTV